MTSHYNYGTEEPFIRDRFEIELGSKNKIIQCQVVFDSSNYYLPPDVIFERSVVEQAFDIETVGALLPASNWDLKNQDCLYDWFENMISKFKKPPKSPTPEPEPEKSSSSSKNWNIFDIMNDSDDDFVASTKKKNASADDFLREKCVNKKRSAMDEKIKEKEHKLKKAASSMQEYHDYDIFDFNQNVAEGKAKNYNAVGCKRAKMSDPAKSIDFGSGQAHKKIDLMKKERKLFEAKSRSVTKYLEQGEEFMKVWKRRLSDYILQFNEQDTGSVTMYMPFEIDQTSEEWLQYIWDKDKSLNEYKTQNRISLIEKTSRPKPVAPMIVHLDLMSTHLKVKLISVMNTDKQKSAGVDHIDINYSFDQQKSVVSEVCRIQSDIKKQAIHFHLFQKKAEEIELALKE
ncbi:hypothetical protein BD408DRAFT_419440 [Parasitella parasitica]|nr:hypothetical protein BD408DRAFT_419440 [Parasitella parasitica]